MIHHMIMTADEAIEKLKSGNMRYLLMNSNSGNVSAALRKFTYEHGQHPHAIIVTCSDSRVIPETIFSASLGELFVIRVAGNVIDDHQLGSIEYAAGHLGSPVVVVLGHTHCGAVDASHQPVIRKGILSLLQMRLSWRSVMKPMITRLAV